MPTDENTALIPIVAGMVRQIGAAASGLGFGWGVFVSGDKATMIASAGVGIATAVWSAYQKIKSIVALRRAAAAPAGSVAPSLPS